MTASPGDPVPGGLVPDGYDGRFRAVATVLESPEHGPQLCYAVAESLPPQCGGPDIAGWSWDRVESQSAGGTTWGSYVLVGMFDGDTFTLTEPAVPAEGSRAPVPEDEPGWDTPCPEPSGGWRPVDPGRATERAFQAAAERAQAMDGFAGLWIDQRLPEEELTEQNANDPARFVLNVATTGDVDAVTAAVREVWGGSLCVVPAARTEAELAAVQGELADVPGMLGSYVDARRGEVVVDVLVATEAVQRRLDERHGAGTVRLRGALVPLD